MKYFHHIHTYSVLSQFKDIKPWSKGYWLCQHQTFRFKSGKFASKCFPCKNFHQQVHCRGYLGMISTFKQLILNFHSLCPKYLMTFLDVFILHFMVNDMILHLPWFLLKWLSQNSQKDWQERPLSLSFKGGFQNVSPKLTSPMLLLGVITPPTLLIITVAFTFTTIMVINIHTVTTTTSTTATPIVTSMINSRSSAAPAVAPITNVKYEHGKGWVGVIGYATDNLQSHFYTVVLSSVYFTLRLFGLGKRLADKPTRKSCVRLMCIIWKSCFSYDQKSLKLTIEGSSFDGEHKSF